LDIGCGSGLHSLAAIRLGAGRVVSVDIDEHSVETTRTVLARHASNVDVETRVASVFDMTPESVGDFDIVYSWGVLHHTGDLWRAIQSAARLVRPGGLFAFALYRRTRLDPFWMREKRWYSNATARAQSAARRAFVAAYELAWRLRGRDFNTWVNTYKSSRGMNFDHDVHDWLGGFPYQATTSSEVNEYLTRLNFDMVRSFAEPNISIGWFGSGCDEFVYRRRQDSVESSK
jgi:2-polyprenyl-6-hydroxyphenyl methylase/3-demethylubiquinone-9 3-methyltransferase